MEDELKAKLDAIEAKVDAAFRASDKTRKYMLITLIVALVVTVLPMIGLAFAIPTYLNTLGGLGL